VAGQTCQAQDYTVGRALDAAWGRIKDRGRTQNGQGGRRGDERAASVAHEALVGAGLGQTNVGKAEVGISGVEDICAVASPLKTQRGRSHDNGAKSCDPAGDAGLVALLPNKPRRADMQEGDGILF